MDSYRKATLWPYGVEAVLSHETVLDLYELSDVNPAKIHITVPKRYREATRSTGFTDAEANGLGVQERARATRDLDALFHGSLDELLADLDATFATPCVGGV